MKLDVDFSKLHIAASKMKGLEGLANELRKQKVSYQDGLKQVIEFVEKNNGSVKQADEEGVTILTLDGFDMACFQPYGDIDQFYFEC